MAITLQEISEDALPSVLALGVAPGQERFVSSVADSLAEADAHPEGNPWFRAVHADGRPVGFVMLSWDVEPQPPEIHGPWFLWKLLIDHRYQGRGYGREVVRQIVELVRPRAPPNCSPAMCPATAARPASTPGSDSSRQESWIRRGRSSCAGSWLADPAARLR